MPGTGGIPPPLLASVPPYLRWVQCLPPGKKRQKHRGKRGGFPFKLKLALGSNQRRYGFRDLVVNGIDCSHFVRWHSMESLYNWNVQIFPTFTGSLQVLRSPGLRLGGVRLCNIKPLHRTTHTDEDTIKLKIGLINSRSVMNKTFLLNDFFTAQGLDFMFITETWITSGNSH